jgi:hypothetical protein
MPNPMNEISVTYMRVLSTKQSNAYSADLGAPFGTLGYSADIGMDQNALEVSYAFKF